MGLDGKESKIANVRLGDVLPVVLSGPPSNSAFVRALPWLVPLLLLLGSCTTPPPPVAYEQYVQKMIPATTGPGAELLRVEAGSDATLQSHTNEVGPPDYIYLEDRKTLHLFHLDDDRMFTFRREAEGGDSERTSYGRIRERFFWKIPTSDRRRTWTVRRSTQEQQVRELPPREPSRRKVSRARERPSPPRDSLRKLQLRSDPTPTGALIGRLNPGEDVVVIARRGNWEWVRVPRTGQEGWVEGRDRGDRADSGIAPQYSRPEEISHYTTGSGLEVIGCRNADLLWGARAAALRGDRRTVDVQVLTDLCRRFLGGVLIEVWAENESGSRMAKVGVVLGEAGEGWEWPWFFASDDLTPVGDAPQSP
jgi:hypothetical protein